MTARLVNQRTNTQFERLSVLAHAGVYGQDGTVWVPAQREFIKLRIQPTVPALMRKTQIISPRKEPVAAKAGSQ